MDVSRVKRSFNKTFSAMWNCMAPPTNENEACVGRTCKHGICETTPNPGSPIPYHNCNCSEGWTGYVCDQCCDLPCKEGQGSCTIDYETQLPYCDCEHNYTGVFCEEWENSTLPQVQRVHVPVTSRHTDTEWETPVIVCTVLLVLLAASVMAALYRLYRTRHPWLVKYLIKFHARKIDDSNKKYDAFISYRTSSDDDRDYVRDRLLPYLEQEGYVVCIDERDLLPGKNITENLGQAIHDSKRTILVVSPAFIEGKWPEFEVQCALMEWLEKSQRVIPIIYRPIDHVKHKISHSLNHILRSITYIEWPQDTNKEAEFWRRLILALPEKSEKEDSSVGSNSELLDQNLRNCNKEAIIEAKRQIPGTDNLALQLEQELNKTVSSHVKSPDEFIV